MHHHYAKDETLDVTLQVNVGGGGGFFLVFGY